MPQTIPGVPAGVTLSPVGEIPPGVTLSPINAHSAPAPPEENGFQREADALTRIEPFNAMPGVVGHIETGVGNIGAGLMFPLAMVAHPLDTAAGMARMGADAFSHNVDVSPDSPTFQMAKQFMTNPAGAIEAGLGQVALGEGLNLARPVVEPIGRGLQTLGAKNMTRILDRGTTAAVRDARAGIDPGRAMLESGVGPTLTKGGLHGKIGGARNAVGSMIGDAVERADANALAPQITTDMVRPSIDEPINSAMAVRRGPGGNFNTTPFTVLRESFNGAAPGASAPIYGPNADPFIVPSDLWKTIRNIDKNTRFNPDPEVESVNETQRDIRGNLRTHLEAADPNIRPLSRRYAGLTSAEEAMERTAGRSNIGFRPGIAHNLATNTPLNTTLSSGLFKVGSGLRRLSGVAPVSNFAFAPRMARVPFQLENDLPGNAGYGEDFTQGGFPERAPIVPEPPAQRLRLAAQSGAGEIQPMIGVRANAPQLAPEFRKMIVKPARFAQPEAIPPMRRVASPNGEIRTLPKALLHEGANVPPENHTHVFPPGSEFGDVDEGVYYPAASKFRNSPKK